VGRVVAVEEGLGPVREELQRRGYTVVGMDRARSAHAIVVSGMDDAFLDAQNIVTRAPVINAQGMTPEEVARDIGRRLLE